MANLAIFTVLLSFPFIGCMNNGTGYILTLPRILQAGAKEKFCMSLHGSMDFTPYVLTLTHQDYEIKEEFTLWTDEGGCKELAIPNQAGKYDIALLKSGEDEVLQEMVVEVKGQNLITFVQTDKPIYKPGQKVRYRVLTMRRDLKPREGKISEVFIKDPNDIRVKQWLDVDTKGLSSFEFQLADEPKMGKWKIEVTIDKEVTTQTFKVMEYVLPKFEVTIIPPKYILQNASEVTAEVCAKYTYGKPVRGYLNAKVCLGGDRRMSTDCEEIVERINGCHKFTVSALKIGFAQRYELYMWKLMITATVTEGETGIRLNKSHTGPSISYDPLLIKLQDDTNKYFKPSFPYKGRAKVTHPDGTPAEGEAIEIAMINYAYDIRMSKTFTTDKDGMVYFSSCNPISHNISDFDIEAKAIGYAGNSDAPPSHGMYMPRGYRKIKQWFSPSLSFIQIPQINGTVMCGEEVTLDIPYTTTLDSYTLFHFQVMSRGKILHSGHKEHHFLKHDKKDVLEVPEEQCLIQEQESTTTAPTTATTTTVSTESTQPPEPEPTAIPINAPVETPERMPKPPAAKVEEGEFVEMENERVRPEAFEPLNSAIRKKRSFMPFAVKKKHIPVEMSDDPSTHMSHVKIKFVVTPEMSPKASLLVYYTREDGETVADSIEFNVESCFRNKVSMEFTEKQVLPGAPTSIKLEAAPGSVCSVGVLDKSINILGGDNELTPEKVFEKIGEYSLSQYNIDYYNDNDYCEKKVDKEEDENERVSAYMHHNWYSSNYVDAIQAFKSMGLLVMTNMVLETRPCLKHVPMGRQYPYAYYMESFPGAGRAVMNFSPPQRANNVNIQSVETRSFFPESWLWQLEQVGDDGQLMIMQNAPHTITEWIGNTICTNSEVGFGFAPVTSITTFQPFFLSFTLPYSAVRDERLSIKVTVFNYLEKCVMMEMNVDAGYEIMIDNRSTDKEPFCLCGGKSHTKKYYIVPKNIGELSITASATVVPGPCDNTLEMDTEYIGRTDKVLRTLLVKAEGVKQEYSISKYMCPTDDEQVEEFHLHLPDDMVYESARGEISVIGDIMGPALSNLDDLVSQPTGCGEQTMVKFTPNIYVLKYLNSIDQNTEEIEALAMQYLEIGYQRELTFRHKDGSFSAFGESDQSGSTWLTAFVVQSFAQAKEYIYIDEKDLAKSIKFLLKTQLENGCFREVGKVFSSYMMGGLGEKKKGDDLTALTAYVIISLLEANISRDVFQLKAAVTCMNLQENVDDVYTKAIRAYANVMYNVDSDNSAKAMEELYEHVNKDGSQLYWGRKSAKPKPVNSWYYFAAPSAEVEMTAYAMLASLVYYKDNPVGKVLPIAMWMSQQRNAFGGYASTQDTVVGLHALSEFAAITHYGDAANETKGVTVLLEGDEINSNFTIKPENSLLLQTIQHNELPDIVVATVSGKGCALVQANVRYNKQPKDLEIDERLFHLKVSSFRPNDDCTLKRLSICVSFESKEGYSEGMSLVTVSMVTGWSHVPQSLKKLNPIFPVIDMKKYEVMEDGTVNFYFDQIDSRRRCFEFDVKQNRDIGISAPKPATVKVSQYYEKEVTTIQSYNLKTICGTKAEIPRRIDEDNLDPFIQRQMRFPGPRAIEIATPSCPKCTDSPPEDLQGLICQSGAVLKVLAGRIGKVSMKVKSDLKPRRKKKIGEFVSVGMDKNCECNLINPPKTKKRVKRLLIFRENAELEQVEGEKEKKLALDTRSIIVNLDLNKSLERKVRRMSKTCRTSPRQP